MTVEEAGLVYRTTREIKGPILFVEDVRGVAYDELVRVRRPDGTEVIGSVLDVSKDWAMVQVFGETEGMDLDVEVRFTGETLKIPISDEVIGRVFSGSFEPLDLSLIHISEPTRPLYISWARRCV